jgi:hypothetical protein
MKRFIASASSLTTYDLYDMPADPLSLELPSNSKRALNISI